MGSRKEIQEEIKSVLVSFLQRLVVEPEYLIDKDYKYEEEVFGMEDENSPLQTH